jgi:hypothetical protein
MHAAHNEYHFPQVFICCELNTPPLQDRNVSTAMTFLYFNEVFAIPNLSKQLKIA